MIEKITDNIFKIKSNCNVYFLDFKKKIIIDTGAKSNRQEIIDSLSQIINPEKIDYVILTHLHYDHVGNVEIFKNAKFYASKEAIEEFKKDDYGAVLDKKTLDLIKKIELNKLSTNFEGLEVINTPGHTKGSICLWYPNRKILFSGDTLFDKRILGRTDLPTSEPEKMMPSLIKLSKYEYEKLCAGHDY